LLSFLPVSEKDLFVDIDVEESEVNGGAQSHRFRQHKKPKI